MLNMVIKGKIKLWINIFLVSLIIYFVPSFIINGLKELFKDDSLPINIGVNTDDKYMLSTLSNIPSVYTTGDENRLNASFSTDMNNADIIISDVELKDLESKGYTFMEKSLSPIICATSNLIVEETNFFQQTTQKIGGSYFTVISISIDELLNAKLNDKTWEDLNVTIFKGEIDLTVPSLTTNGGVYVWNIMYDSISRLKPNLSKEELIIETNKLYNKCTISNNIVADFYEIYSNQLESKNLHTIFMFPEYLISASKSSFNNRNTIALYPLYFDNSYGCDFYIYKKESDENNQEILTRFDENSESLITYHFAIRLANKDFNTLTNSFYHMQKYINQKELPNERFELPFAKVNNSNSEIILETDNIVEETKNYN